ncbi:hypothetical protein EMIHUDRAFT_197803 [Emiliania huxleyi CCMP1516]|uniref:Uncharacterized protein n=2 Tax=Emiliania huxleyi TaxID=2903 RepID=A0A0D3IDS6_EMIH1|nr:hypothetical protein EMIHUDRAFT_197803 [Emiliania huxleyi CCMP1516]EOD09411.1 hypothetical protein EMIHUDRAFT_197803 [Emiliania huxleyi CCMP1516]|eukprot:XP_005761840.1 hypothetical protein EMIHUDRAFT_197803 [Emiliania huxleyi CCMP1516]
MAERGHAVCWGYLLSGGTTPACAPVPVKTGPSFRERFCTTCRARGVQIHASRLRVVCSGCVPTNKHGGGCWNEGPDADGWPPHRVVNQTFNCIGPPIVILKFATSAPLHRLGEFPRGSCGWYTFRIGRTLVPLASLTSTEPSHVIGIPLHDAIPGVLFSPQAGDVARFEARAQQLAAAVSPSAIPAPVPALMHNPRAVSAALETAGREVAPPPPPEGQVLHAPSDACAASVLLDLSGGAAAGSAPQDAAATGADREQARPPKRRAIGVPWQGIVDLPPAVPLPPAVGSVPPAGAPTAVQVRGGMPAGTPPPSPPGASVPPLLQTRPTPGASLSPPFKLPSALHHRRAVTG